MHIKKKLYGVMSKTNQIPNHLLSEITQALESVKYGSIEIFVQNKVITQITVRNIHKTSVEIEREETLESSSFKAHTHIQKSSVKTR